MHDRPRLGETAKRPQGRQRVIVDRWWAMAGDNAVVIKRIKKGGHGGHHGGAWKVAYADFVTAMMAFFLLMWLINTTTPGTEARHRRLFRAPVHRPDRVRFGRRAGRQGDGRRQRPCRRRPVGDAETVPALAAVRHQGAGQRPDPGRRRRQLATSNADVAIPPRTATSPMPPKRSIRRCRTIPTSPTCRIR